jgi:hypothetical protein
MASGQHTAELPSGRTHLYSGANSSNGIGRFTGEPSAATLTYDPAPELLRDQSSAASRNGRTSFFGNDAAIATEQPGSVRSDDFDAEVSIIAAVIHQPDQYTSLRAIVGPEGFANPIHGAIWAAFGGLVTAGAPLRPWLVAEKAAAGAQIAQSELTEYIGEIEGWLGVNDNLAEATAHFIRRQAARRKGSQELLAAVRETAGRLGDPALAYSLEKDAEAVAAALAGSASRIAAAVEEVGEAELACTFQAWSVDDMLNLEPPAWAVQDILPLGGRVLLFAQSGHHKTNIAVDLACHVGHGRCWHGLPVAKHPVVVVATEDPHGTGRRIAGCHRHYGWASGQVIVVPGGELRLNDPATIAKLKATAQQHFPGQRVGFVIDHYDVSVEGDPTATEEAIAAAAGLRELGDGAAFVLLLAHVPWTTDQRAKVPVALWANVDARLRCKRDEVSGQATLTVQHQKNGRSGISFRFEFEDYEFETNRGGRPRC